MCLVRFSFEFTSIKLFCIVFSTISDDERIHPMAREFKVGQGFLIVEGARSQSDIPQSVGLLWVSGQPVAETST
jgi:hypothetical protein